MIMPLSLEHEGQICRCARSYSIIGVSFRTIFDSLPEAVEEKRCQWEVFVRGDKVDKHDARVAKFWNGDG
jgi:hypothetical protein